MISRKEFQLRKSLQGLKAYGPESYQNSRSSVVGKSLDVSQYASKKLEKLPDTKKSVSIAQSIQGDFKP